MHAWQPVLLERHGASFSCWSISRAVAPCQITVLKDSLNKKRQSQVSVFQDGMASLANWRF